VGRRLILGMVADDKGWLWGLGLFHWVRVINLFITLLFIIFCLSNKVYFTTFVMQLLLGPSQSKFLKRKT
jgi:hypothetical protein